MVVVVVAVDCWVAFAVACVVVEKDGDPMVVAAVVVAWERRAVACGNARVVDS